MPHLSTTFNANSEMNVQPKVRLGIFEEIKKSYKKPIAYFFCS